MWILDKVDFGAKKISKDKGIQGHYIRKKRVNPARTHNNPKYVYMKQHNLKILETKLDTSYEYSYTLYWVWNRDIKLLKNK